MGELAERARKAVAGFIEEKEKLRVYEKRLESFLLSLGAPPRGVDEAYLEYFERALKEISYKRPAGSRLTAKHAAAEAPPQLIEVTFSPTTKEYIGEDVVFGSRNNESGILIKTILPYNTRRLKIYLDALEQANLKDGEAVTTLTISGQEQIVDDVIKRSRRLQQEKADKE